MTNESDNANPVSQNKDDNSSKEFLTKTTIMVLFTIIIILVLNYFLYNSGYKFLNMEFKSIGELGGILQGTLGVAAALAGALVAIKLASNAVEIAKLQAAYANKQNEISKQQNEISEAQANFNIEQTKISNDIAERQAINEDIFREFQKSTLTEQLKIDEAFREFQKSTLTERSKKDEAFRNSQLEMQAAISKSEETQATALETLTKIMADTTEHNKQQKIEAIKVSTTALATDSNSLLDVIMAHSRKEMSDDEYSKAALDLLKIINKELFHFKYKIVLHTPKEMFDIFIDYQAKYKKFSHHKIGNYVLACMSIHVLIGEMLLHVVDKEIVDDYLISSQFGSSLSEMKEIIDKEMNAILDKEKAERENKTK